MTYNNPEIRLREYINNVERYIKYSKADKIVFAENSGYMFPVEVIQKLAILYGKDFEYLDVSEGADHRNMSTGEAYIIKNAYKQSRILSDTSYVWKVSGRIYIRNIDNFFRGGYENNVFLYAKQYDSIQTWFFGAKSEDLKELLLNEETIEDMSKSCIEYAWMKCYKKNKNRLYVEKFKEYPDAEGFNSSGVPYTQPAWKLYLKNVALKCGYFTVR